MEFMVLKWFINAKLKRVLGSQFIKETTRSKCKKMRIEKYNITRKSHKKQVTALGILIHKSEAVLLPLPMDMCWGSPAGWTSLASDSGVGSGKGASSSSMMLMLTK